MMRLGVGGVFGSLPEDLTLLFVLRHREEIVPISDSCVVSLLGLVRGVCTRACVIVCLPSSLQPPFHTDHPDLLLGHFVID